MNPIKICLICAISYLTTLPLLAQNGNYTAGPGTGQRLTNTALDNTVVGDSAGRNLTSGGSNTLLGKNAGFSLNGDNDNTFIGAFAGYLGDNGSDNVIIGDRAGYRNDAGDNTFVGSKAGYQNTTGADLTFIGEDAGYSNTTGDNNVFIGEDAGYLNTSGFDNTFVGTMAGRLSGTGYRNTAVGNEALAEVDEGHHNTAIGDSAGVDNGEGTYNTYLGAGSGAASEHADNNTFVGAYAGWDNNRTNSRTNANRNTYVGAGAGYTNRDGQDNVGIGAFADFSDNNRSRCTFVGAAANVSANTTPVKGFAATRLVRGNDATAFGYGTQSATRSVCIGSTSAALGDNAVVMGYNASTSSNGDFGIAIGRDASATAPNAIALGYNASASTANSIMLGNAAVNSIRGHVNFTATSDGRMKSQVQENVPGLAFINLLRPVTYQMDMEKEFAIRGDTIPAGLAAALAMKKDLRYSGFIAQEVEQVAQQLGYEFSGVEAPADSSHLYGLRYAEFVVPLTKAVQELSEQVEQQERLILSQAQQLKRYEAQLAQQPQGPSTAQLHTQLAQYQQMMDVLTARLNMLEAEQAQHSLTTRAR